MSNMRRITKGGIAILAAGWLGMLPISSAFATDVIYSPWLDTLKFGGDLRLRHDSLFLTSDQSNRDRERFRMRYGFNAKSGDISAIFRMSTTADTGSAGGDGLSANQTEDTAFSRKGLWVDLAYLKYSPIDMVTLDGGKMDNPFWNGWSSSLVWDPDLNPEGYAQELNLPMGLYATLAQFSINESAGFHNANPWMFAERIGAKEELPMDMRGQLSVTDYGFTHEKLAAFGGDLKQGNTRTAGGILTSSFNILQFDGKLSAHVLDLPLTFEGGFVRNTQESVNKGRDGNILGVVLGNASKAHSWELAYYHKQLGANAVIADFVDDDFGYAGTNQGGHIMWVGYAPRDNVLLKLMFYDTHILDKSLASAANAAAPYVNHMMLDVVVKI